MNVESDYFKRCILYSHDLPISIDGSVVECSPATRAARVRFPVDASRASFLPVSTGHCKAPLLSGTKENDHSLLQGSEIDKNDSFEPDLNQRPMNNQLLKLQQNKNLYLEKLIKEQ